MSTLLTELTTIFRDVMENETINISDTTSVIDIEEWDSLNHIYLVVEIEKYFDIKFKTENVASWQNVGDIMRSINTLKK